MRREAKLLAGAGLAVLASAPASPAMASDEPLVLRAGGCGGGDTWIAIDIDGDRPGEQGDGATAGCAHMVRPRREAMAG